MMKTLLSVWAAVFLAGCTATLREPPRVTLEFRTASEAPGPGLTEMFVPGSDRPVYISDQVILTHAEVASARVDSAATGPQIRIVFTPSGAQRFAAATGENLMRPLAILVNGKLVSAPVVRAKITGGQAIIVGRFSEAEARRIAEGIATP